MLQKTVLNSDKVRALIKEQGRTRAWIAAQCGITVHYLNILLSKGGSPSKSVTILLAKALSCNEDDLLRANEEAS